MKNLLTSPLPETVEVAGQTVAIVTGWRTWVDIWRITDAVAEETPEVYRDAILHLAYPEVPHDRNAALLAALEFLEREGADEPATPPTATQRRLKDVRTFDWAFDSSRVVADFMREYQIDLTDPDCDMHFWRFMALFDGLSDTSETMEAISVRAADLSDGNLGKEEKKRLRERKQALMLPARNEKEAEENMRLRS